MSRATEIVNELKVKGRKLKGDISDKMHGEMQEVRQLMDAAMNMMGRMMDEQDLDVPSPDSKEDKEMMSELMQMMRKAEGMMKRVKLSKKGV